MTRKRDLSIRDHIFPLFQKSCNGKRAQGFAGAGFSHQTHAFSKSYGKIKVRHYFLLCLLILKSNIQIFYAQQTFFLFHRFLSCISTDIPSLISENPSIIKISTSPGQIQLPGETKI